MTRAGGPGLQLLEDFLQWDPERRPTAQQALKYPYFQIVKQNGGGQTIQRTMSTNQQSSLQMPNSSQNHLANNNGGRISNVSFSSVENTSLPTENQTTSSTDKSNKQLINGKR